VHELRDDVMGKLGRKRLDTLKDIGRDKAKARRRRNQKSLSSAFDVDGDKILMISKYDGFCAACGERTKIGQFIWFDPTLPVAKRVVHRDCHIKTD
jgi:hypothetical protein